MYINYKIKDGIEYAMVVTSVRKGSSVTKEKPLYLGRVIDKEQCIFKNRERGIFKYDIQTNTFSSVPAEYQEPPLKRKTKYPVRPTLVVSFGDVFLFDEFLKNSGFIKAVDAIEYRNGDTLRALLAYYILSPLANSHAEEWWELTYARYLYPRAQMSSQRISDALADIGSEDAKRCFFKEYYRFLEKTGSKADNTSNGSEDGILIDSSGLPNSIRFPLTAVNTHNGVVSEEVRLIYVIQQRTGLPLFFRYVPGNIIDVTSLTRTVAELKANGINTKFAILDAGYYTGTNADVLLDAGISFITRMKSNFKVYKQVVSENIGSLEAKENLVRYNRRLVYIKCVPCLIGAKENRPAYAYLCRDLSIKHELEKHLIERAEDQNLSGEEIFDAMQEQGIFVLVSSRCISKENLLPLYYTRDQIEKIFELCKQDGKILPLNVATEATFRGHLMMTFMAAVILKLMSDRLKKTSLTTASMFMNLHEQHAIIYDNEFITTEPVKKMNEAYKAFKVQCPATIPRRAE